MASERERSSKSKSRNNNKQSFKSETTIMSGRTRDFRCPNFIALAAKEASTTADPIQIMSKSILSAPTLCRANCASKRRRQAAAATTTLIKYIILLTLASGLLFDRLVAVAVIRPTVFRDTEEAGQPQQQPAAPQVTAPSVAAPASSPISDGAKLQAPSTTISPLRSRFCTALTGAKLDAPLGLQSMAIDDLALSASSFSNGQVGPQMARLNLDISGGAWCPVKPISNSNFGKEWIQAKLNRSFVITAIETQGRYGMGNGKEFVPSYQVEYSRNGGHTWHKWKDLKGSILLRANEDVNSPVRNELSPPIVGANVIRILPHSPHLKTVCLRFELHGCPYDEGAPMAYTTTEGVVEPRWGHLIDYTYDGIRRAGLLNQGLGQLVDGVKGHDNFSHNSGFEWVGWKKMNGDVVIEFSFKTVRNFTGALFHSNNLFSSGVEVFSAVDVHYGIDVPLSMEALRDTLAERRRRDALYRRPAEAAGSSPASGEELNHLQYQQQTLWSSDVLSIEYEPDKKLESSRPVTVHLKQRLANRLRFVLKFASKWILVSEVEFLSHPVELLSLASVDQQATPALLVDVAPAKSYDEFLAILREHQLRRIVTSAMQAQTGANTTGDPTSSSVAAAAGSEPSGDQPSAGRDDDDAYAPSTRDPLAGHRVTGPAIPSVWPPMRGPPPSPSQIYQDQPAVPSTILVPPYNPAPVYNPPTELDPLNNMILQLQQQPRKDSSSSASADEKRTLGLATVISFVLVSILVFVGVLFAVSSYRLRHQPKLGVPHLSQHQQQQHHHHHHAGTPPQSKSMSPPSLQSFMSVFSSPSNQQHQLQQHHHYQDNHFNALFATTRHPGSASGSRNGTNAAQTLRRLATIGQQQRQQKGHPLLSGKQQQANNQLLVSVKDSGSGKGPVSTQLILGLNQANPLAQQQVYSSCNGQPYSTSLSMASSSTTTGHQGDYGEYAIPDAQPIIPPLAGIQHHQHMAQFGGAASGHQHLNQAFSASPASGGGGYNSKPFGGCQPESRSHLQHSLIQPQVIHNNSKQRMSAVSDHKYELIQQQERPAQPQQVGHNRTLSGQMQQQQQQQVCGSQTFNSMTLGHGRAGAPHDSANGKRPSMIDECSPGANSNTSGATTATTSANSSSAAGDLARYYSYVNE